MDRQKTTIQLLRIFEEKYGPKDAEKILEGINDNTMITIQQATGDLRTTLNNKFESLASMINANEKNMNSKIDNTDKNVKTTLWVVGFVGTVVTILLSVIALIIAFKK